MNSRKHQKSISISQTRVSDILKALRVPLIEKKEEHPIRKNFYYTRNYLPPFLHECACKADYNRTKHSRREVIADRIGNEIIKRFDQPGSTIKTLNYLSLGAGGLLQDYFLCLMLLKLNFSLNIYLIERDKDKQYFIDALSQFKDLVLFASHRNLAVKIYCFFSYVDFIDNNKETIIDLACAIDFIFPNENYTDLLLTHQRLSEKGIFYLALEKHDYLFNKHLLLSSHYSGKWRFFEPDDNSYVSDIPEINALILKHVKNIKQVIPSFNNYIITNILLFAGSFEKIRDKYIKTPRELEETKIHIK